MELKRIIPVTTSPELYRVRVRYNEGTYGSCAGGASVRTGDNVTERTFKIVVPSLPKIEPVVREYLMKHIRECYGMLPNSDGSCEILSVEQEILDFALAPV